MAEKPYGIVITDVGRSLIAGWSAGSVASSLTLARIMVGDGLPPDGTELRDLKSRKTLISPFAPATSTVPRYDGDTVHMTIEYRNDLNGGLQAGKWLSEYGIFVPDPNNPDDPDALALFAYATLGDAPQYVSAYGTGSLDSRRFLVSITIGEGVDVSVTYALTAFMTAEDVEEYMTAFAVPQILDQARELIALHNAAPDAHQDIRTINYALGGRISLLEDMLLNDVAGNPFLVTFGTLDGISLTQGVWNQAANRLEC